MITDPVIRPCGDCGREYRTYIPDTTCVLPGGINFSYVDPQVLCPLCDPQGWGAFMNEDLFPELIPMTVPNEEK